MKIHTLALVQFGIVSANFCVILTNSVNDVLMG